MGLSDLVNKAKNLVQKRGGGESARTDAEELQDVARGDAGTTEKTKEGAEAVKDPGAKGPGQ
jgi:hypothetical protein